MCLRSPVLLSLLAVAVLLGTPMVLLMSGICSVSLSLWGPKVPYPKPWARRWWVLQVSSCLPLVFLGRRCGPVGCWVSCSIVPAIFPCCGCLHRRMLRRSMFVASVFDIGNGDLGDDKLHIYSVRGVPVLQKVYAWMLYPCAVLNDKPHVSHLTGRSHDSSLLCSLVISGVSNVMEHM